jgi:hypothetical protein
MEYAQQQQQQKRKSFHTPDPSMCTSSYVTANQVILKLKDKSGFGLFTT